jgi:hypothetical protein
MAFIDAQRAEGHAVESICRVLREQGCRVAARTYRAWKRGRPVAARTHADAVVMDAIIATAGTPEGLYGRRKMTAHLRRQGYLVSYDTVDRLMKTLGRNGVRRGKAVRTTIPAKDGTRAGDLLNRVFTAPAPNRVWVADFTYCRTWAGFVYVAFVVDVFAQRIVAWHAATDKRTLVPSGPATSRTASGRPCRASSRVTRCFQPVGSRSASNRDASWRSVASFIRFDYSRQMAGIRQIQTLSGSGRRRALSSCPEFDDAKTLLAA